ncbi:hypothetical protein [Paenibacillus glacialis]|uniref:Uncharacterized protein n=1 Tax=Paenibacillus glacialis TaxID=494026 RepID=A0A168LJQ4_9BACL|nr:hypothetical protein [Paenibacillus glacialis]OAB43482.1 hypothetical protein PGLA_08700 [Paenibacillus glacialis]
MNNPTFIAECREHRNKMTRTQENGKQSKTIDNLHNLSQLHMNSTGLFIQQHSPHVCIILGDRALKSMFQALYMKENNSVVPSDSLSLEDVMELIFQESGLDLDTMMFINSIHYLASLIDISPIEQMEITDLKRLMQRVDDVLIQLSARVTSHPSDQYRSIF